MADQLGHQVAVAGDGAGQHAGLLGQLRGVDQVAVVAEGELRCAPTPRYTGWALRQVLDPVVE